MMLGIASMVLSTSCSKDNEDLIVGKWKCVSNVLTFANPISGELETEYNVAGVGETIEFSEDGMYIEGSVTTRYSISGNILYIYSGEEVGLVMEIKKLTKKELTLVYEERQTTILMNYEKQ